MSQIEQELTRTLADAATSAPPPGRAFLSAVRIRQYRRRRRQAVLAATCAAVLVLVGSVGTVRLLRPADRAVPVADWSGTVPDFATLESPERIWPEAVHRLPGTLPDGRRYQVRAVLGADRYLVDTSEWARSDSPVAGLVRSATSPAVFDVRAGTVRQLGAPDADYPSASHLTLNEVLVVGDRAVWTLTVVRDTQITEIWSARLAGSADPLLLHRLGDGTTPHISALADRVYWDQDEVPGGSPAGIYQLPVSGGTPTLVPGSTAFRDIFLAPWVDTTSWAPPTPAGGGELARSGQLWNLTTGQRLGWVANSRAAGNLFCDPVLCAGLSAAEKPVLQRLDGTGFRELPYDNEGFQMRPAVEGRFGTGQVTLPGGRTPFVWDRVTGRAAVITTTVNWPVRPGTAMPEPTGVHTRSGGPEAETQGTAIVETFDPRTVQWSDGAGGFYVLDLTAIG